MSTPAHGSAVSSLPHGPSGMGGAPLAYPGEPPPVRHRGDACPGTLRLHTADDGALARVRVPGGALTAAQALVLARAAERLGDGELHLTSRGNVQLRGLTEGCGTELADELAGAGLLPSARHERVRNVVTSPLSGLDGRGYAQVPPWVAELDRLLCASPAAAGLSGRFLFAVDDGRGDVAALGADVTVVADPRHGMYADAKSTAVHRYHAEAGTGEFAASATATVFVGGTAAVRVAATEAPRVALLAAEAFLDAVRAHGGQAWRVRELPQGGTAVVHALRRRMDDAGVPRTAPAAGATRTPGVPATGPEPGIVHGPDGRSSLSVSAPFGTFTARRWRLLAAVARTHGTGELRLTPWRGVVVPRLDPRAAQTHLAELAAAGLVTTADSPWHGVSACVGRPGCAKSLADVRADARTAVQHRDPLDPPVHWSGCARRCGRPEGPHLERAATANGRYDARDSRQPRNGDQMSGTTERDGATGMGRSQHDDRSRHDSRSTGHDDRSIGRGYAYEKDGAAIYRQSFATIRAEADLAGLPADVAQVAVRMIHACGMVDLVRDLAFSPDAVARARAALRAGAPILTDVQMVASGVTRKRLPAGNDVLCTLSDPGVPALAAELGTTRTAAAMELWGDRLDGAVVAFGNAPTALFRLLEMVDAGAPRPAAVIGVPVGFVGAVESKDALVAHPAQLEHLVVRGRRGGSALAAAALNAIASEEE